MKILIGGDFCPEYRAEIELTKGNDLFEEKYRSVWNKADYRVLNLEGPITQSENKISKVGRHIKFDPSIVKGLMKMNIDMFSLANNHIMDYGLEGYEETLENLKKAKISYFGCSDKKYKILEKDQIKVALLSFSNKEFSLLSEFEGRGAYPIDLIDILNTMDQIKKITNNIIIILHTGLSKFPYPSPNQKKLCRFLIDKGATSVLCQHSHTIGSYEHYKNGFISYGQGSFVFNGNFEYHNKNSVMSKGYSVQFFFDKNGSFLVDIIFNKQFDKSSKVRLPDENETQSLKDEVEEYNYVLNNESLYLKEWESYVKQKENSYFRQYYFSKNKVFNRVFRTRVLKFSRLMSHSKMLVFLNLLRNDEHSELMIELLRNNDLKK